MIFLLRFYQSCILPYLPVIQLENIFIIEPW